MKTLATCKPTEFIRQTVKIKKFAETWLRDTNILEIYKTQPKLKIAPPEATSEERIKLNEENKVLISQQSRKNLSDMFDAIMEEHPEETLTLLALCCFIEPEDIDNHTMEEYLDCAAGLIGNASVINFFTSLALVGQMSTSPVSRT